MSPVDGSVWVTIGRDAVACGLVQAPQRPGSKEPLTVPIASGGLESADQRLRGALNRLADAVTAAAWPPARMRRVSVLVSEPWVGVATVPWSERLARQASGQAHVREHLELAGVSVAAGNATCVADEAYGRPRTVAAYPSHVTEAIVAMCSTLGWTLQGVAPLLMAAAAGVRGRNEVLAVVESGTVGFVQPTPAAALQLGPPVPLVSGDDAGVAAAWSRWQLRQPAWLGRMPRVVRADMGPAASDTFWAMVGVTATAAGRTRALAWVPDGQRQRLPVGPSQRFGWALLAVALAACSWGAARAIERWQARADLMAAAVARDAKAQRPTRAVRSRDDESRSLAARAAMAQLGLPLARMLADIPPPRDVRVAMVGVEVAGSGAVAAANQGQGSSQAGLKLTADAATVDDMARYVAYLAQRPNVVSAYLVSHQVDDDSGKPAVRFRVDAVWRE